jgi:hypothetical protein
MNNLAVIDRAPQMDQAVVNDQFADIMSQGFSPVEQAYFNNVDPYSMDAYLQGFAAVQLNVENLSADTPLSDKGKEALLSQQLLFAGIGEPLLAETVSGVDPAAIAQMHSIIDQWFSSESEDKETVSQ